MLFGQNRIKFYSLVLISLFFIACSEEKNKYVTFLTPEGGATINSGQSFKAKLDLDDVSNLDSIVYFIDTVKVAANTSANEVEINTGEFVLGNHVLMAKIFKKGTQEEITTNIIILAASAPKEYAFKLIKSYPHDAGAYVQGLEYHNGYLYESTGQRGQSSLRKVEVETGKVVKKIDVPEQYFAEGLTKVGNKLIQLTYQESVGFVYDFNSFKKVSEFSYPSNREGWGLCFDGEKLYNSDGSSTIYILDKNTYQTIGSIEVYDHRGQVNLLNELEYIDGKIYANIYDLTGPYANKIVVINPNTGAVESTINLIGLHPLQDKSMDTDYILNGIAYNKNTKRLYVTGKYWPKLFEIEIANP